MPPILPDPFVSPASGGTEIYLIRHADAVPEADEIMAGDYDAQPLSTLGRAQAGALATRLHAVPFAVVYSSPILRARQTAEALAAGADLPVILDPELREVDLRGVRPDLPPDLPPAERIARLRAYLHAIVARALAAGVWSAIPGVEPGAQVRARMQNALARIAARHPGRRVALVSHSGAINAALAAALDLPRDFYFPIANTAISIVRVKDAARLVLTINDHAHLAAATPPA
jgi:probable phosphoglycerate mutase